jgi:uncharacterized protein YwqG
VYRCPCFQASSATEKDIEPGSTPGLNVDWRSACDIIKSSDLAADSDELIAQLGRSVRIFARREDPEDLKVGSSRMGGCPDLPSGFEWPRYGGSKVGWDATARKPVKSPPRDKPLDFIAQIRLEEVAPLLVSDNSLPATGMLYFFYDIEHQPWGFDPTDRGAWRVLLLERSGVTLVRARNPEPESSFSSNACSLSFNLEWSLPEESCNEHDEDWCDAWEELAARLSAEEPQLSVMHRLLGHPQQIQGDMALECQLVSNGLYWGDSTGYQDPRGGALEPGKGDWRLLLQVDSDEDNPGWMWGDSGRIYFWIRDDDLRQRRFENCWLVLQCY